MEVKLFFPVRAAEGNCGSEGPGEDLGIEILADVQGGSVDGLCPKLLLVRPELGLLCGARASPQTWIPGSALGFRGHGQRETEESDGSLPIGWWTGAGAAARGQP